MLHRLRCQTVVAAWLLAMVCLVRPADAHDTGFAHSRRTMFVTATAEEVQLEYRVTANADEALIEMALADQDRNGEISLDERDRYFTTVGEQLSERFQCETNTGERLPLKLLGYQLDQALSQTFTFRIASAAEELKLIDKNFAHKPGQVRIIAGTGVSIELIEPVDLMHTERVPLKIKRQNQP